MNFDWKFSSFRPNSRIRLPRSAVVTAKLQNSAVCPVSWCRRRQTLAAAPFLSELPMCSVVV